MKEKYIAMFLAVCLVMFGSMSALGATSDGDITVDVSEDDPIASIPSHSATIVYDGTQAVDIEIDTNSEDDAVSACYVNLTYDGTEGSHGDAEILYESGDIYDSANWDGSGTYTDTQTFDTEISFARYGSWSVNFDVVAESGYTDDSASKSFSVDAVTTIDSVASASATGNPGDTLSGYTAFGSPDITITANHNWGLSCGEWIAEDSSGNTLTGEAGNQTYSATSGDPTNGVAYEIHYQVTIPVGQPAGTYDTEVAGGTSPTHTLSNTEV